MTDTTEFERRFGAAPSRTVVAPGRVNLIGEHTDYNGLPVLPMALQRGIRLVFRPRSDSLVRIVSPEFGERSFEFAHEIEPFEPGDWGNYVKAAARGVARGWRVRTGIDAWVESDLPVASGLSSSSALVIACALALLDAAGVEADTLELADAMAAAERYVGLQGGGMDQTVILGARAGHACRIDFDPLRLRHLPIPDAFRFVVADTLVRAEKSARARDAYNQRVRECREAVALVSAAVDSALAYRALVNGRSSGELLDAAAPILSDVLLRRFRHVVTEYERVEEAESALVGNDPETFGRLMDASHASLRDDYEVSSPELDEVVGIMKDAGAAGARLTGAGFGGCAVALCAPGRVADVIEALADRYYVPRGAEVRAFEALPSVGASVLS